MQRYWFSTRKIGWGWTPTGIEGWTVIILYILGLVLIIFSYSDNMDNLPWDYFFNVSLLTILLFVIAWKTAEPDFIRKEE
ncbi:MAG: hypothetical protein ACMXYG_03930 [Candidatus Woesearchaeota archaeon]